MQEVQRQALHWYLNPVDVSIQADMPALVSEPIESRSFSLALNSGSWQASRTMCRRPRVGMSRLPWAIAPREEWTIDHLATFWMDPASPAPSKALVWAVRRTCHLADADSTRSDVATYFEQALYLHRTGLALLGFVPESVLSCARRFHALDSDASKLQSAGLAIGQLCSMLHTLQSAARRRSLTSSACPPEVSRLVRDLRSRSAVLAILDADNQDRWDVRDPVDHWLLSLPWPTVQLAQEPDAEVELDVDMLARAPDLQFADPPP
jgi:hypothetical protein